MTLNDKYESLWIYWQFRIARHIAKANCAEINDMDKLHMKFTTLNVDFDRPSLDFLGSRKPAHEGIKERYPRKSRYFTVVGKSTMKTVSDHHGHAAYHNKH